MIARAALLGVACLLGLACDAGPAASPPVPKATPAPAQAETKVVQRVGFPSDLKPDEELRLFPAVAAPAGPGAWEVRLRAWVYEPEEDSLRRGTALAALAALLELPSGSDADAIFTRRARGFLVDNERGKKLVVQIGLKEHVLADTGPNGQSETVLRLSDEDLPGPATPVVAVLPDGDTRRYAGTIFRLDAAGASVISDVDDTIKISEVRDKPRLLERTFLREFEPVPGVADRYRQWAATGAAFHYLSASPWQLYDSLVEFTQVAGYPAGSMHLKLFRAKDSSFFSLFQDPKAYKTPLIDALIGAAPGRRFVLVGDSGELDPEAYADAYRRFPAQVAAIYIRDVTGEPRDAPRYQAAFSGIPEGRWQIFTDPTQLPANLPPLQGG